MPFNPKTFGCHVSLANFARSMLKAGFPISRRAFVFVAAVDFELQRRAQPVMLPAACSPVALLPAPADLPDEVVDEVAPPMETVLYLRFLSYSLDIDSLADADAVDLQQERDWCDYWYSWHASQLDAS